jgi:hypothetical protein
MTIGAMLGAVLSGRIVDLLGPRGLIFSNSLYMSLGLCRDFKCNMFINSSFLLNFGYNCEAGNGTIRNILCCGVACNNLLKGFLCFPCISVWIHYSICAPFQQDADFQL